eukprot:TRINITY_DN10687_c0_g2_i11.p1 TRINITY_DN10687_c0_g2~~TRINITY_DN10687_c0_g2_i11.p1  ORF type:complete len:457 (+),score=61.85 TRINITY_DN10687_c0_g2_i11:165-1535(+)
MIDDITETTEEQGMSIPAISSSHFRMPKMLSRPANKPSTHMEPSLSTPKRKSQKPKKSTSILQRSATSKKGLEIAKLSFNERMEHFFAKKKESNTTIARQIIAGEKLKCTFSPQINSQPHTRESLQKNEQSKSKGSLIENGDKFFNTPFAVNRKSASMCSAKKKPVKKSLHNSSVKENKSLEMHNVAAKALTQTTYRTKPVKRSDMLRSKLESELNNILSRHKPVNNFATFCTSYTNCLDTILKEFGLIKNAREEVLARKLYKLANKRNEIDLVIFKELIFAILHISNKNYIAGSCFSKAKEEFEVFHLNKMMQSKLTKDNVKTKEVKHASQKEVLTIEELLTAVQKVQEESAEAKRNRKIVKELDDWVFSQGADTLKMNKSFSLCSLSKPIKKSNNHEQALHTTQKYTLCIIYRHYNPAKSTKKAQQHKGTDSSLSKRKHLTHVLHFLNFIGKKW